MTNLMSLIDEAMELLESGQSGFSEGTSGNSRWYEDRARVLLGLKQASRVEPFVVKHYASDERPTIKGNGFDGLEVGEDRQDAEDFVKWLNECLTHEPPAECPHCREVYEIWANTEGFTPVTAPESYQQQVMTQMRDAAARGLSADQPAPPPVDNDHVAAGCEKFGEHHE